MQIDPDLPPPTNAAKTALGQAFAAILAILIAALADHARENPSLAGLIRLTIKRLEASIATFDAMVAAHESAQSAKPRRAHFSAPRPRTPGLRPRATHMAIHRAIHMAAERRGKAVPSLRRAIAPRNPATAPRAPP